MNRRHAIAEDLRKLGTGLMLAAVISLAFKPVSGFATAYAVAFGLLLVAVGVLVTPEENDRRTTHVASNRR